MDIHACLHEDATDILAYYYCLHVLVVIKFMISSRMSRRSNFPKNSYSLVFTKVLLINLFVNGIF